MHIHCHLRSGMLAIFAQLLFPSVFFAQSTVYLSSQADINSFQNEYISGTLVIGTLDSAGKTDIRDLSPLSNLKGCLEGGLIIQNNPGLHSLHGLENFKSVGGFNELHIINNDSLVNFLGMSDTIYTGERRTVYLLIYWNDKLLTLEGLPVFDAGDSYIAENQSLRNLNGLGNRKIIGFPLIEKNPSLETLDGLTGIDTIAELTVRDCPKLKTFGRVNANFLRLNIERLDSLESTEGVYGIKEVQKAEFKDCPRLRALKGFETVGKRVERLYFINCPRMSDFSGWSDSAIVNGFRIGALDSIKEITSLHRVHAISTSILSLGGLKGLKSLPTGVPQAVYHEMEDYLGASIKIQGKELEYLHHPPDFPQPKQWGKISVSHSPKLKDIEAFTAIHQVLQGIYIYDNGLPNLNGLRNLDSVGLGLLIGDDWVNYALRHLSGLGRIKQISGGLGISQAPLLTTLKDFKSLKHVDRLYLEHDSLLTDFSPFDDHVKITEGIGLNNLPGIMEISGFDSVDFKKLTFVESPQFGIINMPNLTSIKGFDNLDTIPFTANWYPSFTLSGNPKLKTIEGFQKLRSLRSFFEIKNNPSLEHINGLCGFFKHGQWQIPGSSLAGNPLGMSSVYYIRLGCDTLSVSSGEAGAEALFLQAWPNPAIDVLHIKTSEISEIQTLDIYDMSGRTVRSERVPPGREVFEIPVSGIPPGVFLLRAKGRNGRSVWLRFVVL